MPFCLTAEPQPWWRVVRDIVVILMFYAFFYYLTHRFLFHDSALLGGAGPLKLMHAVLPRQPTPCRGDPSFIPPPKGTSVLKRVGRGKSGAGRLRVGDRR